MTVTIVCSVISFVVGVACDHFLESKMRANIAQALLKASLDVEIKK